MNNAYRTRKLIFKFNIYKLLLLKTGKKLQLKSLGLHDWKGEIVKLVCRSISRISFIYRNKVVYKKKWLFLHPVYEILSMRNY